MISNSVAETIRLGQAMGRGAVGGEVIALVGELGTGKTYLIKGIAQGLDVADSELVTSPTFTLINEYEGRLNLYHIDAYRLDSAKQLEALGFDELYSSDSVIVVEWADRVWPLVEDYEPMRVNMRHAGPSRRMIEFERVPEGIAKEISEL